ncbi:unnamed protein product [Lymnaea stagnalis]|uniref:Ectonucleoside triphosphate diphosphohydrolase 5 n=1 Tax=Lymnaea stagnalis TaxID=6523 RepID=A0AAV2I181_LYMST
MRKKRRLSTHQESLSTYREKEMANESLFPMKSIMMAVLIVVLGISILNQIPGLFHSASVNTDIYSIVFDAGSTGSRIFVLHFVKPKNKAPRNEGSIKLDNEVFQSVEPGISAYAQNPPAAAESLLPLLEKALKSVPKEHHSSTQIIFKATAGLRLLQKEKADAILHDIRILLKRSPFYLPDPESVSIMSEEAEGVFGWVSVNFLLDFIWNEFFDNSVSTFDLGGGSAQVTFEVASKVNLLFFLSFNSLSCQNEILIFEEILFLTFYSYLGFGLKSARLGILGGKEGPNGSITYDNRVTDRMVNNEVQIISPCFYKDKRLDFNHSDVGYEVWGLNEDNDLLPKCSEVVKDFVISGGFVQSHEISERELHLFSYFFDVARWAKLISWNNHMEVLHVKDYLTAARTYCQAGAMSSKHPFLCIDLLYVYTLLTAGIGLSPDKEIHVEKKILGREVSWCLGAALSKEFNYTNILAGRGT